MLNELWKRYKFDNDMDARDKIIVKCLPMIKIMAQRLSSYTSVCMDFNDLISVGMIGLLNAINKYDLTKQSSFKTYAIIRIRGAMLDEIRSMRWITPVFQRKLNQLIKINSLLEQKLLRPPTEEELAKEMNMKIDKFRKMMVQIGPSLIFMNNIQEQEYEDNNIDECYLKDISQPSPEKEVVSNEAKTILVEAIKSLPKKSAIVISLYYYEEMTMKEIAKALSLTESRVCQIHSESLIKLFQAISKRIKSDEIQVFKEPVMYSAA